MKLPYYSGFTLDHFFVEQFSEHIQSPRFRIGVYRTSFLLRNVGDADDPEELLRKVIDYSIKLARQKSERRPKKFSVIIRSSILNQPIQIPYRSFEQNSPDVIIAQFKRVDQSGRNNHGRPSLYSQPLHIEIVMGPSDEEAEDLVPLEQGSGKIREIKHNINRSALIDVKNNDSYCLFLAIELTRIYVQIDKKIVSERNKFNRLVRGTTLFYAKERNLLVQNLFKDMKKTGVNINENLEQYSVNEHAPELQRYFDIKFPNMWRIAIFGKYGRLRPLWKGPLVARYELPIFLENQHFYGIRNLNVLLNVKNYCLDCESPYDHIHKHKGKCKSKCRRCLGKGFEYPCIEDPEYFRECMQCHVYFKKEHCFEQHKLRNVCSKFHRCLKCGAIYSTKFKHQCGFKFCRLCLIHHDSKALCLVQPIVPKRTNYQLVIYDCECTTHNIVENRPNVFNHSVNCVSALLLCNKCISDNKKWTATNTGECHICGINKKRLNTWIVSDDFPDPLEAFLRWLLYDVGQNQKFKIIALAHYSGRYDMHLIAGGIYRLGGLAPRIIRSGNKLYELALDRKNNICPEISFRDTFNWMPLSLAELPKALELGPEITDKMFFPHGYNKNENLDIILETLPSRADYFPDAFSQEKKILFEKFYTDNYSSQFWLREQLKIYCENDVVLLTHAVVKFRRLFESLATKAELVDDIVSNSLTIASACIRHYCINFLRVNQIAIIPELGYHKRELQSHKALNFLKWYSQNFNVKIRHRDNNVDGEYRLFIPSTAETFKLDGFVSRQPNEPDLCLEFNGCAWHGHSCLYEPEELCLNGKTSEENLNETRRRKILIEEQGLEVRVFWECEVDELLEQDCDMRKFYKEIIDPGPLIPRDGFFGGRTGPMCLKCDLEEMEPNILDKFQILYFDFVSLYPCVNFYQEYPLGHPKVKLFEMANQDVRWTDPVDCIYRGLLKVFIIPPKDLYIPVVPLKINGKLMFFLCYECAREKGNDEGLIIKEPYTKERGSNLCTHNDAERGFVATITDIELNMALRKKYIVTKLFSVYHWEEWTQNLFRPYVQQFMKLKLQASGWPDHILKPEDPMLENNLKEEFIENNQKQYGIQLDPAEIKKNEGLRWISKICNNSMWGRWSLRNNLGKDLITDSPMELHSLLNNPKLDLGAIQMISNDLVAIPYTTKKEFIKSHNKHNIMLAIITTAAARVKLYKVMEQLHSFSKSKILYTDTDSIIVLHPKDEPLPFEEGSMLGQLAREYGDCEILAFYSGGCKQYGLKLRNKISNKIYHILKFRGITLNTRDNDEFNFDKFKEMVNNYSNNEPLILSKERFRADFLNGQVLTQKTHTSYTPIYDKGIVDITNFNIYPFGYCGEPIPGISRK